MRFQRKSQHHRAFTLVEMIVVIMIIVVLASLAAGFMPRAQDSTNLSNGIDQLEQWLLTAKMRAKRDSLATGIRFITDPLHPGFYTQFQYVQQPDSLSGGTPNATGAYAYCYQATPGSTTVNFSTYVDFSLGGLPATQWLVLPFDYLELRDGGGIHLISAVLNGQTLTLSPAQTVTLAAPTANYRILRQPRPLIGENPLQLPGNIAVDLSVNPSTTASWSTVMANVTGTSFDILFSPSGAVVGTNAGLSKVYLFVHDMTQNPVDTDRAGVIAVQTTTGYIGGYNSGPAANPYSFANTARSSGL